MKTVLTGGHLTPALALLDFIQAHYPQDEMLFVGRVYSQKKLKQKAVEQSEVEARGIRFIPFSAVKWGQGSLWHKLLVKPFVFAWSVIRAIILLAKEKPDVVVSFGGYLAVPIAVAAKTLGIKLVTHEGTRVLSWSNQVISKLASAVAVSYPEVKKQLERERVVVTGTPIREKLLTMRLDEPDWIKSSSLEKPLLMIMGGNQGSKIINQTVAALLESLLADWSIVHICGRPNKQDNYQQQLEAEAKKLPPQLQSRYWVKPWVEAKDLAWLYQQASAAVSRAGANTCEELARAQVPTVFIPLPYAHLQEQLKNARWLAEKNAALILTQDQLSAENLIASLKELKEQRQQILHNLAQLNLKTEGARNLYQLVLAVAGK